MPHSIMPYLEIHFAEQDKDTPRKDFMIQMRIVRTSDLKPKNAKEKRFGILKMHNGFAMRYFTIELAKYFRCTVTSADWVELLCTIL